MQKTISIKNKKAFFEYHIIDKYIAGIVLQGTEIKSIRYHQVNLSDGYALFKCRELWLNDVQIAPYKWGTYNNHAPKRSRKLLLKKKELIKIQKSVKEKGITIIPLHLFVSDRGLVKIEIGLAKGKKLHDKRASLKDKDVERQIRRAQQNVQK